MYEEFPTNPAQTNSKVNFSENKRKLSTIFFKPFKYGDFSTDYNFVIFYLENFIKIALNKNIFVSFL